MMNFLSLGTVYLEHFTYLAVFLFLVLNGTGFFPFPEEATLLIAGYLLSLNIIKLTWLIPASLMGIMIGDSVFYFVGRMHPHSLKKYGKHIFLSKPIIDKFHIFFEKHGGKAVFLSRFIMGFRIVASFFAGSRKMKYSTYVFYNLAGALIWAPVLISVGYLFGSYIEVIILGVRKIRHGFFIIFMVLVLAWLGYHYFRHLLNPKSKRI